jgi:protein-S-isoprenylcysteine O-methyltransferase Ste14
MYMLTHFLIPALWIGWLAYWIVSARGAKKVVRAESIPSRLSHGVPLVLAIVLLSAPHLRRSWLMEWILPWSPTLFWVAVALVAVGLAFAIWARVHLAGNWSGTVTLKQNHSLTRDGPYRLVRHPIYTGILIAILGSAIAEGEWRGVLALVLTTGAFLRKIAIEERFLTAQFGEAYARYRTEVPALVPWLHW